MPLDPMVKAFLDRPALLTKFDVRSMPLAAARQAFAASMAMLGPQAVAVGEVRNLAAPGPAGDIPIRFYAPAQRAGETLPALVYFHGGGFVLGDLDTHDGFCRLMAAEGGVAVLSVAYRLAPENKWPAALDDALAATQWVAHNAAALGLDAARRAVGGDSAGGLLAASVAQLARTHGPALAFQMLLFPATQFTTDTGSMKRYASGYGMERQMADWFYDQLLPPGSDRAAPGLSPLHAADFSGLPPAFIMLAGSDPLHDDGQAYAEKLKAAGVAVRLADYPGMLHCFIFLEKMLPQAHGAACQAAHALAAALGSGEGR